MFASFQDEVVQNEALFARIKTVYDGRANAGLTAEEQRIAEVQHDSFARQGAGLDGSSYVAMQQWVHDMDAFEAMDSTTQDNTMGRNRRTNEELERHVMV